MERSWKVALPAPPPLPPPPVGMCAKFVTPQEYDSTSTSSLCLSSRDSPLMSLDLSSAASLDHRRSVNDFSIKCWPRGARHFPAFAFRRVDRVSRAIAQ